LRLCAAAVAAGSLSLVSVEAEAAKPQKLTVTVDKIQNGGPIPAGYVDPNVVAAAQAAGVPFAEAFAKTASIGIDPRLVMAVAWVESGFAEDVIGCRRFSPPPANARGIMQFLASTARGLGIDPCDPPAAIQAGAEYLKAQFDQFKTWELAAAAYNAGAGAVKRYGGIPPFAETQQYVPKVMARWQKYQRVIPAVRAPGSGAAGGPRVLGSTARYTESMITATTQRMLDTVIPEFGRGLGVGCYRSGEDGGEHPRGRACDFIMANPLNTDPTPDYLAHGNAFCDFLIARAADLHVRYIIWQKRIWFPDSGWRPYTRYDGITQGELKRLNHYDHVHVSLNWVEGDRVI
jgi:hypothetical protein